MECQAPLAGIGVGTHGTRQLTDGRSGAELKAHRSSADAKQRPHKLTAGMFAQGDNPVHILWRSDRRALTFAHAHVGGHCSDVGETLLFWL